MPQRLKTIKKKMFQSSRGTNRRNKRILITEGNINHWNLGQPLKESQGQNELQEV